MFALGANLSFAIGSMFFTYYARRFSSLWVNTYKALIAAFCFGLVILFTSGFHEITIENFSIFFISGLIALGIGDIFLIKSFQKLGPARTMVIFGFHPVIVGIISYFTLGQLVEPGKLIGIIFFIICLFTFSLENYRSSGKWEITGLLYAFAGMGLDAVGIIITRYGFDMNPELTAFEGNFYRCIGALFIYWIISLFRPFDFVSGFRGLTIKSRSFVIFGSLMGTFLSLALYLEAIKTAHLASLSAIAITSVIFTSLLESIWDKKLPSKYLLVSFVFFLFGMHFILFF
jgi:drug/metabolite transporter (DMT)-like permease